MPTNFRTVDMSPEALQAYQEALLGTTTSSPITFNQVWSTTNVTMTSDGLVYGPAVQPDHKARERADLKQLIATGQSDLKMYSDGERLVVKGFDIDNVRTLFIMDSTKMLAPKKRTTHLKALLIKLAQREGVELEFTNQLPETRVKQIVYWPFKLEVDDSALLQAKPAERIERPERECDDPDCVECAGDDPDDDIDWDRPF